MRADWISVEIRVHSTRGTCVWRAVLPAGMSADRCMESEGSIIAKYMSCIDDVRMGMAVEVEMSYSEPSDIELDDAERSLARLPAKVRPSDRWRSHWVSAAGVQEVPNGR